MVGRFKEKIFSTGEVYPLILENMNDRILIGYHQYQGKDFVWFSEERKENKSVSKMILNDFSNIAQVKPNNFM